MIWLNGCANLPYYVQAVDGHFSVVHRSQPIHRVIADPRTDDYLKQTLSQALKLREFASLELKLPDNLSYTSYADIKRPYVVWNVFASPELSLKLKEWCFIQAGCVNYRGFFSQANAERYAEELRKEGYDVYVGGVRAYSTLGWFSDPILNTFIGYSEAELARLIFHELAHQVIYVPGDSVFNESFATAVEHEGVSRWFASYGSGTEQATLKAKQERETVFAELVLRHRERLQQLFRSELSDADKRIQKAHIFDELREEFSELKAEKKEFSSYDRWFSQPLNNAALATVAIYTQLLPAFQVLLTQHDMDMERFFDSVKKISRLPKIERDAFLQKTVQDHQNWNVVERK